MYCRESIQKPRAAIANEIDTLLINAETVIVQECIDIQFHVGHKQIEPNETIHFFFQQK